MGRFHLYFFCLWLGLVASAATAEECAHLHHLPAVFAKDFGLDVKKSKIEFRPVALAAAGAADGTALLLSDLESCTPYGDCDSALYLRDAKKCFNEVLAYRGKWLGPRVKPGRALASVAVETRSEGDAVRHFGILRVERVPRVFDFDAKTRTYEESK